MSEYVFTLPDLGEGTVEAEIVEWHVQVGDVVAEDDIIADVMTDKANVEIPSPVSGTVIRTAGEPGEMVAVGGELIVFTTDAQQVAKQPPETKTHAVEPENTQIQKNTKVLTSPAIRRMAQENGIDLSQVQGSGPKGRILRSDLSATSQAGQLSTTTQQPTVANHESVEEIKIIGVRRVIAERMSASKREIPHFAYVEEVDITALESLRQHLNAKRQGDVPSLTYLPFIGLSLIRALKNFPMCNALFDKELGVLKKYSAVNLGIATQTPDGLKVPVVHNAHHYNVTELSREITRVSSAARDNTANREILSGSTITITSLGKMGGIVTTPVINAPEVAIIGVNKAVQRPMVNDGDIKVRLMMNLSGSFDHRFVDGFDAASMVQNMKELLEEPAMLFID